MTTEAMELLNIAVLKIRAEDVVARLLRLGIFHPVDITHVEESLGHLSHFQIDSEYSSYEALETRLSDLVRKTGIILPSQREIKNLRYEEIEDTVKDAENLINPLIADRDTLSTELKTKESILSQLDDYEPFSFKKPASSYTFLKTELGSME